MERKFICSELAAEILNLLYEKGDKTLSYRSLKDKRDALSKASYFYLQMNNFR